MAHIRFMQDCRGGVAPMFALAIIPIFGLVGAAVDYSRANSVRAGMQSAIEIGADTHASSTAAADHGLLQRNVQSPRGEEPGDHADLHHRRWLSFSTHPNLRGQQRAAEKIQ